MAGCLYKSNKYVGTFGVAKAQCVPAEPAEDEPVAIVLTVHFSGKASNTVPAAKVKVLLDGVEIKTVSVLLTPPPASPDRGLYTGNATVNLGAITAGEHRVTLDVVRPSAFTGAIQPPVTTVVAVTAKPRP